MTLFMAKIRPKWQGCSRLDRPTWKVSSAPYHTPIHGRAWFRAIFARSRHISRVPGVQKWHFLWWGCSRLDRPTSESAPGYTAQSLISQRIRLIKPHKYTANFFSSYYKLFCIFPEIEGFKNHWDPHPPRFLNPTPSNHGHNFCFKKLQLQLKCPFVQGSSCRGGEHPRNGVFQQDK